MYEQGVKVQIWYGEEAISNTAYLNIKYATPGKEIQFARNQLRQCPV